MLKLKQQHHLFYIDTDRCHLEPLKFRFREVKDKINEKIRIALINDFFIEILFPEAEELSSRLMHTIIDIRNDENGRVVLEEAKRDKISNPFDLQCIYFEELLSEYRFQNRS